ncbi:MAG: hypothetical protein JL50_13065 [Peptococcaceae bacterium BICA1-7]|nr:MAG: hypothetical protein JL50_13065 [Peptococcaceae bacterium BICA1-7]
MGTIDVTERNLLGFQEEVKRHFEYLISDYGYRCVFSDPYCVKFQTDKVYLNIYHEKISYEVYVEIGLIPEDYQNKLRIGIKDIIENSASSEKVLPFYQASNPRSISKAVGELAKLLRIHGKEALAGQYQYYKKISEMKLQRQQTAYTEEMLKITENRANDAWKRKDFSKVIELYEPIKQHLNTTQIKKLEYAKSFSKKR